MLLNLLNLFSLIIALFKKIETINKELDDLRNCRGKNSANFLTSNETSDLTKSNGLSFPGSGSTTTAPIAEATAIYGILHAAINDLFPNVLPKVATIAATAFGQNVKYAKKCISVPLNCSKSSTKGTTTKTLLTSLLAMNFATTILPEISSQLNGMELSSSSTTTLPYTDMDFYYNSTSFDELTDNETTATDTNGMNSMGSTAAFPFNHVQKYDYDAATPTPLYEYYDEDSNDVGEFLLMILFFFCYFYHCALPFFVAVVVTITSMICMCVNVCVLIHWGHRGHSITILFFLLRNSFQFSYHSNIPEKVCLLFIKSVKIAVCTNIIGKKRKKDIYIR